MAIHKLPALPYSYDALEPAIDARTMEIHHSKHHNAYVNNLNAALEQAPQLAEKPLDALLGDLSAVPEAIRTTVRNNGGGHFNHTLFWQVMGAGKGGTPAGPLADAIAKDLGSFEQLKQSFGQAAATRFGSGWAWLSLDERGRLLVHSTPNQDSPLMEGRTPLLGLDVWEHAYYLKYQNRRADYIAAWWDVVDWDAVTARFLAARG